MIVNEPVPCRVLVADPPWKMRDALPSKSGKSRGAARHYRTLGLSELQRFPLPPLAPDCVLFLWRLSSMVEEAYQVARAWGFTPKTELVWIKTREPGPSGALKLHFGMGRILRGAHETCLVATRGRPKPESLRERTVFLSHVGAHSEKPGSFFTVVERIFPLGGGIGTHVELFARRPRAGWATFGDELEGSR